MPTENRSPIWHLVYDCVKEQGGRATLQQIAAYLEAHGRLGSNARPDAISLSVNENSRIHYAGGRELRRTDTKHRYDLLFHDADGSYVLYDSQKHGVWEIYQQHDGTRGVRLVHEPDLPSDDEETSVVPRLTGEFAASTEFRLESHLRDYLAQNLGLVQGLGTTLRLFEAEGLPKGVEYLTNVGRIDILAVGENGAFYVLELKLSKGPDAAVGQILRYMAAVRATVAKEKPVFGVIVASTVTDRLRYAVSEVRDRIFLLRYELQVSLEPVQAVI
jgi:endonuclease